MKTAVINPEYECTIDIIQEGIANEFASKLFGWNYVPREESPFKDWLEPMDCYYAEPSGIYVGVFSKESQVSKQRKSDTIILHIYPNVPMWNMANEIKDLLKRLGVVNPKLQSRNYVRSVAQGALKLMEIEE